MKKYFLFAVVLFAMQLSGCANQQSLTQEEVQTQGNADASVAAILFDNNLDQSASYNVHKDGFVVIKFSQSVSSIKYTKVVEMLRSNPAIHGVRAEQNGIEVCPLNDFNPQ